MPAGQLGSASRVITRRELLRLAGVAGTTAAIGACTTGRDSQPLAQVKAATQQAGTLTFTAPNIATPAQSPIPESVAANSLLCRDTWRARQALPGGRPHTITRMTIHHTAVVLGDNRNSTERLRQHQRYHMDEKGWVDIAYHMGVDRDGNIFELRRTEIAGDTATNYDTTGHFLVVCEGNFDEEQISEAQLDGAALAFAWATQTFGITSSTLKSHREVTPTTECPGANLQAHVASGDLKRRIDDSILGGAVNLQPLCMPQAADLVAAIEAGR